MAFQTSGYAIAYINFEKEEDAAKAIAEMNNTQIGSNHISVELYDRSQQAHVFVAAQDVISSENLKALYLRGLNKKVSFFKNTPIPSTS